MTDEKANENTALWPSQANIVSVVFQHVAVASSFPTALARPSKTMYLDPDAGIARSRPRRTSRRCIHIFLCAFVAFLIFSFPS